MRLIVPEKLRTGRPAQDNMPGAATAPAHPATNMPEPIDVDSIKVPSKPTS